jgi:outer membrane protein assembly factor BamB
MTGVPTSPKRSRFLLGPGALRAIDASTLKELWNSNQEPDPTERLGNVAKFTPVTVANGKVYVPTFSNKLIQTH